MASDFMKFHTRSTVFEETQCLGGGTILTVIKIEKTERSDTTNLQSSIFNLQFRLVRVRLYFFGLVS